MRLDDLTFAFKQGLFWRWGRSVGLGLCYAYGLTSIWLHSFDEMVVWQSLPEINSYSLVQVMGDHDLADFLIPGLRHCRTFADTFAWWHSSWVGVVPFWRPLTSQFFWIEYHLFGVDRFDRWQWVSLAFHFIFLALLVLLVRGLTRSWHLGALAAFLFYGSFSLLPSGPDDALTQWKNQPEQWTGCCTLAAMLLSLTGRWGWSLTCAVLSVCFKESGWLTFSLVFLTLLGTGRLSTVPRWVYAATVAAALALIALRAAAGPAVFYGYHYGDNIHWWERYSIPIEGTYFSLLLSPSAPSALLAAMVFGILLWRSAPRMLRFGLLLCAVALCGAVEALSLHSSYGEGLYLLLTDGWDGLFNASLKALVWLALAWCLLRDQEYRRLGAMVVLMILLTGLPMAAAAQVREHVLYLNYALQGMLSALALMAALRVLFAWCLGQRAKYPWWRNISLEQST